VAEDISSGKSLTHLDAAGNAVMVDVTGKDNTVREAKAAGVVTLSTAEAYRLVKSGNLRKGDVLGAARIAAILAAKKVDELIPLTHPLLINKAEVAFSFNDQLNALEIEAKVGATGKTGVEMEALTAVSMAALTVYDMCKAVDKNIVIGNIRLLRKTGGKSGTYCRSEE